MAVGSFAVGRGAQGKYYEPFDHSKDAIVTRLQEEVRDASLSGNKTWIINPKMKVRILRVSFAGKCNGCILAS